MLTWPPRPLEEMKSVTQCSVVISFSWHPCYQCQCCVVSSDANIASPPRQETLSTHQRLSTNSHKYNGYFLQLFVVNFISQMSFSES